MPQLTPRSSRVRYALAGLAVGSTLFAASIDDALARRIVEVLRELYRTRDLAGQLERLPRDLDDELAPFRAFAMERIARLLRDSVIIPPALREKVVRCLDDEAATGRRQAAVLLDELDEEDEQDEEARCRTTRKSSTKSPTRLRPLR